MNTLSQQLQSLRDTRASKSARARELDELRTNENRAFSDDERTEVRSIRAELADIDDDIAVKEAQSGRHRPRAAGATAGRGQQGADGVCAQVATRKTSSRARAACGA